MSNAQIHKYKYTNTQIQHMMKYQKDPICGIFLKRGLFKGYQNDTPMCQTCKYKKNTHIQKYSMIKCQKHPTCGIFLKRGLFKGIKNYIPTCRMHKYKNTNTKYTNTSYGEVQERPDMWHIFEKGIVQGYQK